MKELELKYGCNPNQKPSRVFMKGDGELPFTVVNGKPGFINLLDAFNGWQLVKELKKATKIKADKVLFSAIGWLAREGKVVLEDVEDDVKVTLL